MQIVPQSAAAVHCLLPFVPRLMLPAPRIAGLLPARVPSSELSQITVFQQRETLLERQRAIWAAQDAELQEFFIGARQRLAAAFAASRHNAHVRSALSVVIEVIHAP